MSTFLLIAAIVLAFAGLKALAPSAKASKPCLWGYKAFCTFTPISSFILFWLAGCAFIYKQKIAGALASGSAFTWFCGISVLFLAAIVFYLIKYFLIRKNNQAANR